MLGMYVQNNRVVSLRSKEDIRDLMRSVQKGDNVLLWCDGLQKEDRIVDDPEAAPILDALDRSKKILL